MSPGLGQLDRDARYGLSCGLHVRNLEESLRFYRDIVGCEVFGRLSLGAGELVALRFGNAMLKLLQWHDPPEASNPPGLAVGLRYLTFHVVNPDALVRACEKAGLPVQRTAYDFSPTVRNAIVLDPDGNTVELCHGEAWEPA